MRRYFPREKLFARCASGLSPSWSPSCWKARVRVFDTRPAVAQRNVPPCERAMSRAIARPSLLPLVQADTPFRLPRLRLTPSARLELSVHLNDITQFARPLHTQPQARLAIERRDSGAPANERKDPGWHRRRDLRALARNFLSKRSRAKEGAQICEPAAGIPAPQRRKGPLRTGLPDRGSQRAWAGKVMLLRSSGGFSAHARMAAKRRSFPTRHRLNISLI
jgi:hypothetical protein